MAVKPETVLEFEYGETPTSLAAISAGLYALMFLCLLLVILLTLVVGGSTRPALLLLTPVFGLASWYWFREYLYLKLNPYARVSAEGIESLSTRKPRSIRWDEIVQVEKKGQRLVLTHGSGKRYAITLWACAASKRGLLEETVLRSWRAAREEDRGSAEAHAPCPTPGTQP